MKQTPPTDRHRFIERAPLYYALAIAQRMRTSAIVAYDEVRSSYHVHAAPFGESPERRSLLGREDLFDRAVDWLIEAGLVTLLTDDFAHPLLAHGSDFGNQWEKYAGDPSHPFGAFARGGQRETWLQSALTKIDDDYILLGITPAAFESTDPEWAPIHLEATDESVQAALAATDAAIEAVRGDNGYAANIPGERDYVLEKLTAFRRRIAEETTITVAFTRAFALEPLGILLKRFRKTASEVTFAAAKIAIVEMLKKVSQMAVDHFFK